MAVWYRLRAPHAERVEGARGAVVVLGCATNTPWRSEVGIGTVQGDWRMARTPATRQRKHAWESRETAQRSRASRLPTHSSRTRVGGERNTANTRRQNNCNSQRLRSGHDCGSKAGMT
eukprot:3735999-Rhodomonas_salina.1